jgi:hypothetical protein
MAHLVRAGSTLIRQVDEHRTKVTATPGDIDGINRYRSIEFDAKTSKWLKPILEACDDPRIASLDDGEKSHLVVRFVGTVKADDPSLFALDEADAVLNPKP